MASIQRLKKELSYVTTELLFGCYVTEITSKKANINDVTDIAKDVAALHQETITKINEYKRSSGKSTKDTNRFFKQMRTDLVKSTQIIVDRLESLK